MVLGDDVFPGHAVRAWDGVIQAHGLNAPGLLALLVADCTPHGSTGDGGKLITVKVRAGKPPLHSQQIAEHGNIEVFIHREDPETGRLRPTYYTFKRVAGEWPNGIWQFCGCCFQGETVPRGKDPIYC